MFKLYLGQKIYNKVLENYVPINDSFFNIYTSNYDLSALSKSILKIDGVKYIGNGKILTKYNILDVAIPVTMLSTGCKTFLNVATNTDKVFFLDECGENALSEILELSEGQGYLTVYMPFNIFKINVQVIIENEKNIVFTDGLKLSKFLYDFFNEE